jgi:hypothetical protein
LYKIRAPPLYAITTLGRRELRGKLIIQRPHASDPEPRQERAAVRNAQRERASYEDVDEQVRSRVSAAVQCPPPRSPCVGRHREGLQLPAVSRGDSVGDDCRDNESDESDHDPGADGDNKRKRAKLPGSADNYDDQRSQRRATTSLSVSRSRLTTSPTVSSTGYA